MRYPDLFLINEAWAKAERFEGEVRRAHLLAQIPKVVSWRYRLARLLLSVAGRLEPKQNPLLNDARRDCCRAQGVP